MKRSTMFSVIVLSVLLTFAGCKTTTTVDRSRNADSVTSVQIYDLRDNSSKSNSFLEKEEPVYTVAEEKTADFLSDLGKIQFTETKLLVLAAVDPGFSFDDWTVRLNYSDGSYLIFSSDGYAELYNEAGEVIGSDHGGCDQEQWDALIEKYLPEEILNGQT